MEYVNFENFASVHSIRSKDRSPYLHIWVLNYPCEQQALSQFLVAKVLAETPARARTTKFQFCGQIDNNDMTKREHLWPFLAIFTFILDDFPTFDVFLAIFGHFSAIFWRFFGLILIFFPIFLTAKTCTRLTTLKWDHIALNQYWYLLEIRLAQHWYWLGVR